MKKINYKILSLIWLAIGISISGYFYIFPVKYRLYPYSEIEKRHEDSFGPRFEDGKHSEVAILITFVGSILIGGIGYITSKKNSTPVNKC